MKILAIDPGDTESAFVVLDTATIFLATQGTVITQIGKCPNHELIGKLARLEIECDTAVIEKIESFGMAVGAEVFETVFWSGRFAETLQHCRIPWNRLPRKAVKMHLCGTMRAKDAHIRQALIDRYGGPSAIGKKKTPGALYGISGDVWAALAVAVTWADQNDKPKEQTV